MNWQNHTSKIWQLFLLMCILAVVGLIVMPMMGQSSQAPENTPTPFAGTLSGVRLIVENMDSKEWAGSVPNTWSEQSHPRYDITLTLNTDVLEVCNFSDGGVIERWQYYIDWVVIDLTTDTPVALYTFYGDEPQPCPDEPDSFANRYVIYRGTIPERDIMETWLRENLSPLPNLEAD